MTHSRSLIRALSSLAKDANIFPAENEDADPTAQMLRLICASVGHTCQEV